MPKSAAEKKKIKCAYYQTEYTGRPGCCYSDADCANLHEKVKDLDEWMRLPKPWVGQGTAGKRAASAKVGKGKGKWVPEQAAPPPPTAGGETARRREGSPNPRKALALNWGGFCRKGLDCPDKNGSCTKVHCHIDEITKRIDEAKKAAKLEAAKQQG